MSKKSPKKERQKERAICSWWLDTRDSKLYKDLETKFDRGSCIYNAALREAELRRRSRQLHPDWDEAKKLSQELNSLLSKKTENLDKISLKKLQKECKFIKSQKDEKYKNIYKDCGYSSDDLVKWGQDKLKNSYISDYIQAHERNALIVRAFTTSERKGRKGNKGFAKVKYIGRKNPLTCISGQSDASPLKLVVKNNEIFVQWNKNTQIKLINPNYDDVMLNHILKNPGFVTFTRVVRVKIKGKWQYKAQFTFEGKSPKVRTLGKGFAAIDFGVSKSTLASYEEISVLKFFDKNMNDVYKKMRVIQRKIDRQRRANNPENFDEKGCAKKGKWIISNRQKRMEILLAEMHRKITESRKCFHGKLINQIRAKYDILRIEKNRYYAWQRNFGKQVGWFAPGMFYSELKRVFEETNGKIEEIDIWTSALTQTCPNCGNRTVGEEKKKLKDRIHDCQKCGFKHDRDSAAAIGALFYDTSKGELDVRKSKTYIKEILPLLSDKFTGEVTLPCKRH